MNPSHTLPAPGLLWGNYPEHRATWRAAPGWLAKADAALAPLRCLEGERCRRRLRSAIAAQSPSQTQALRQKLSRGKLTDALIVESFRLIDAACERELGLRAYDTQLAAARLMLENRIVEMATGEGKTVAALFAAATAALAGVPVHVITTNDYLAARDAETLRKVYAALGLRVGAVTHTMAANERREAYACDVTYCTAKELVFDYLRDGLARRAGADLERRAARLAGSRTEAAPALLRGLCMAIVDEADSVLIDEARVPLVLSQAAESGAERAFCEQALKLARTLETQRHYRVVEDAGIELTADGLDQVAALPQSGKALERNRRHREEAVLLALTALHRLRRDHDYLVADGKVVIIEPTTGRPAHGRAWSRGLQQLVELKEGVVPSAQPMTIAQITYQRFFPRYLRLCGMSGTAYEARAELFAVYGCRVSRIPLRQPSRRRILPARFFMSADERWSKVVERIRELHLQGRPVLVGTASVAGSEALSRRLHAAKLPHAVLNARNHAVEAAIVAAAGEAGRITVTTNMAGRGTDIALAAGVAERGGLHVILCQHNASSRIDRQLLGRCARRGEPGSCEAMLALDDLPQDAWGIAILQRAARAWPKALRWIFPVVFRGAAWRQDARQRAQRRRLREDDARAERSLPAPPLRSSMEAKPC